MQCSSDCRIKKYVKALRDDEQFVVGVDRQILDEDTLLEQRSKRFGGCLSPRLGSGSDNDGYTHIKR